MKRVIRPEKVRLEKKTRNWSEELFFKPKRSFDALLVTENVRR